MEKADENRRVVREFLHLCNRMGNEKELSDVFAEELFREHRTVQQVALGVLKVVIDRYGALPKWSSDLRNEAAMEWARRVRQISAEDRYMAPEMRFPFL